MAEEAAPKIPSDAVTSLRSALQHVLSPRRTQCYDSAPSMMQAGWRFGVKRAGDVTLAATMLVALAPVLGVTAIAIRVTMGRPVLFVQERPGRASRPFRILKFRTMRAARGSNGEPLSDEERLTRLGRLIRSTSVDELPQLLNVLRGEMSLVGPRPLLTEYLSRYSSEQARRHDVLPGITGWAQVNGRNAISWRERFRLDVWYVDNWSPILDAKILLQTIRRVLQRSGISRDGHATMPKFGSTEVDP